MREVVINRCYGGFDLSEEAQELYLKLKNITSYSTVEYFYDHHLNRHDPILVSVVKQLGDRANGSFADLKVVEVQGRYRINEYDGFETIEEEGRWL
ncbi:MAG: hypothetical protein IM509_05495 [Microcystis sp. M31BS1]|uniref:hypothetical protein n=1 Tax=Microcystis sp. M31BS1 TaxID=2771186 RepID=UPI002584FB50|nr:hypothetical protein [Microcystis sp. M31BS1]MCA2590205.1 hypothetical protein [Microcystis sp. M31BS1]